MKSYDGRDQEIEELTSTLLRSLRQDVAPGHAKRATLAALGIGAATTVAAGSASALVGVARVGVLAITKAVVGGALAGAVVVGTSTYVQDRTHARPATLQVSTKAAPISGGLRTTEPIAARTPANVPDEKVPAVDEVSLPSPPVTPRPERPRDEAAGATIHSQARPLPINTEPAPLPDRSPVAKPSALSREIALLDESRGALARNDSREALRVLDRYAREFERGNLWPEAVVLRIDALLRQGDAPAARFLADQFEQARPNDSHVSRIQSLFATAGVSRSRAPGTR
jgi:hypothetical protein